MPIGLYDNLMYDNYIDYVMKNSTKGDTLKLKANAGENIGHWWSPKFDYSREKQKQVNKGPLPERNYSFNPQGINKDESRLIHEKL